MKIPSLEVSGLVILSGIFALFNIHEALPVRDETPGGEANVWYGTVKRFYGPWSDVHTLNGGYADYNDYGVYIQDFQPGPEDLPADEPVVAESGPADFQSNYGNIASDESGISFQPSTADVQSAAESQDCEDQGACGDPENHDFEGNVQWISE